MKYYIYSVIISLQLLSINQPLSAAVSSKNWNISVFGEQIPYSIVAFESTKKVMKMDLKKWLPLGLGILGIALIFVPYLSLLGLIAGVAALITGLLFRKKYPKMARWGILLGGLCIVAFLGVLGLVLFF